ncbi:serine/arginine repetitive matrix protein 2 [Arthrobacter sp. PGP41]|uniref:EcsC family protein n=1 Tax=Arthrobacter sp. PGP41 TaxID=2079227 RepID=UPI000CDC6AEE|nr:EcsC family protein [Arthrobacter sp. PGP41]AUZ33855.1 serine/arginine repetitive matrix protein 2 [Arthrobacter sp. PGP41]
MTEPSTYELEAWQNIQRFKGRPLSQAIRNAGEQVAIGAEKIGERATQYLEERPGAQATVVRGQELVSRGAHVLGTGARKAAEAIPDGISDWSGAAFTSMRKSVARVSRAGLSPKQVVAKHRKRKHAVSNLSDLRRLDLEQVDAVRGRGASWGYPLAAALSGAGAGLAISGGELAVPLTGGAAAAPSGAVIAGAFVGDAALVLALGSRCVGEVSLHYGYDPEEPAEKLFIMSVVNAGTAVSAGAKSAALADISRLTQALVRKKTWEVLDKSIVSQVSKQFAKAFGVRLTKQGLGKVVPVAGILVGGTLNWTTLEGIFDAANIAYRRRFLLEKYPRLEEGESQGWLPYEDQSGLDDSDEPISVLGEIVEAGGPDLH